MKLKYLLHACALVACLIFSSACSKLPPPPNAIAQSAADAIASQATDDLRNVRFGDRYILLGGIGQKGPAGYEIQLAWKSLKKIPLDLLVAVHIVDKAGKIIGQADFPQSTGKIQIDAGTIWRDSVTIPYEKLVGADAIAIGLFRPAGQTWEIADHGPRDWDNRRLLILLPQDLPTKGSTAVGFLEAAQGKYIAGWAWDSADASKHLDIEILDGANPIAKVAADQFRADLLTAKIGDGKYSFQIPTPAELKDGKPHEIHAKTATDGLELRGSPITLLAK